MARKKNRRRAQSETRPAARTGVSVQWVVVVLLFGLMFGGAAGYFVGSAISPGQNRAPITDAYGRSPGHAHYNHDHP